MTDWREHNGGPQPVGDDVWVRVNRLGHLKRHCFQAGWITWGDRPDFRFRYRILNQHLIDAARLEGIRLGLEAAGTHLTEGGWVPEIKDLDPDTIAKEADQ